MIAYNTKYYKQITPLLTRPDRTEFYICNTNLDTAVIIAHTILTSILYPNIKCDITPLRHTHSIKILIYKMHRELTRWPLCSARDHIWHILLPFLHWAQSWHSHSGQSGREKQNQLFFLFSLIQSEDDDFNMCLVDNVKTMNQGLIDTLSLDCLKRNDETAKFKVKWGISRQLWCGK